MSINQRSQGPIHLQFERELSILIDEYLMVGIDLEHLKNILLGEAENDHEQIMRALKSRARRSQHLGGKNE